MVFNSSRAGTSQNQRCYTWKHSMQTRHVPTKLFPKEREIFIKEKFCPGFHDFSQFSCLGFHDKQQNSLPVHCNVELLKRHESPMRYCSLSDSGQQNRQTSKWLQREFTLDISRAFFLIFSQTSFHHDPIPSPLYMDNSLESCSA